MPENDLLRLLMTGFLSTGVFALTLYLLGLDEEDLEFINILRSKFRKNV
jgi:hypothetical protein